MQFRVVDRSRDERAFELTVDDALNQAAGSAGTYHRANLRVSLGKLCDQVRQAQGQGGFQRADFQDAFGMAVIPGGTRSIEQQLRKPRGERQDAPTRGRHLHTFGAALKQRHAEFVFQRANPRRNVRLHGVQLAGGLVHAAVARDRIHHLEIRYIHRTHLSHKVITDDEFTAYSRLLKGEFDGCQVHQKRSIESQMIILHDHVPGIG